MVAQKWLAVTIAMWASGGYQPGKMSEGLKTCNYPYGGKENKSTQYEVMVPHWESASGGQLTQYPYEAGIDSDGAPLYVCSAQYGNGVQPGKLKQGAGCYIAYGGTEYLLNDYEVLQRDLPMTLLFPASLDIRQIIGGFEPTLCVANYYDGSQITLQPGKWLEDDGMCYYSYAGAEVLTTDVFVYHPAY